MLLNLFHWIIMRWACEKELADLGKGMQSSFPNYPPLHAVKYHQLLSGDPRETLISVTHVKVFGICKISKGLSELIRTSWHTLICHLSQELFQNRCPCEVFHCIMILVSFSLLLQFQFDLKILLSDVCYKAVVDELAVSLLVVRFSYL